MSGKRNIEIFKGRDYSTWKTRMRSYLKSLKLLDVIDDKIPEKITDEWTEKNDKALFEITDYLDNSLIQFVQEEGVNAKNVFQKLDATYERSSDITQMAIKRQLNHLKMENDETLQDFFGRFDSLIIELTAAGGKPSIMDKVTWLTAELPQKYESVMDNIKGNENARQDIAQIKARLLEKEDELKYRNFEEKPTQKTVMITQDTNSEKEDNASGDYKTTPHRGGFRGRGNFRGRARGRGGFGRFNYNPYYNPRGRGGHGSFRGRGGHHGKQRGHGGKPLECFFCGRLNHMRKDCEFAKREQKFQEKKKAKSKEPQVYFLEEDSSKTPQSNFKPSQSEPTGLGTDPGDWFVGMAGNNITCNLGGLEFVIDSGATDHFVTDHKNFESHTELEPPIQVRTAHKRQPIFATKMGIVRITTNTGLNMILDNVLYSPDVSENLLSVKKLQRSGFEISFKPDGSTHIQKNGNLLIKYNNGESLPTLNSKTRVHANICNSKSDFDIWHKRLGHLSKDAFIALRKHGMFLDMNTIKQVKPVSKLCESCTLGKQSKLSSKNIKDKSHINRPLQVIHSDICGPVKPTTFDNKNYFMIFVDEYTHYCETFLAKVKSELFTHLENFVNASEANFSNKGFRICDFYIDNGT